MNVALGYCVGLTAGAPTLDGNWHAPVWQDAETLDIGLFHPRSSSHRPRTQARLLHDRRHIFLLFRVTDQYIRSAVQEHNGPVCTDSCVEFFVQPRRDCGYFNFEVNCGGWLHLSYVQDPTRMDDGDLSWRTLVPAGEAAAVGIYHSMPRLVPDEILERREWVIQLQIPLGVMERYVGALGDLSGQTWQANLYKCGDRTSHPHWATWAPIGEECNFHQPWHFRPIHFA